MSRLARQQIAAAARDDDDDHDAAVVVECDTDKNRTPMHHLLSSM